MQAKAILLIATILSFGDILAQPTCESRCPVYAIDQGICASDGKVYTDLCRAQCKDRRLKEFFACEFPFTWLSRGVCADECEHRVNTQHSDDTCASYCPTYFQRHRICASNGCLFTDLCRAKCKDDSFTEVFDCGLLDDKDCLKKCRQAVFATACQNKCTFLEKQKSKQLFCGTDGEVYDSLCKAQCVDKHIQVSWTCAERRLNTKEKCFLGCRNDFYCREKCCDAEFEYLCGKDGLVYNSNCELECQGQKALYVIKPFSTDEKNKCWEYALKTRKA